MKRARDPYLTQFFVRMRSWGGLVSMGLNMFLVWAGWGIISEFHDLLPAPNAMSAAGVAAGCFAVVAVINHPIDYMFGYLLERHEGRLRPSPWAWHLQWFGGSLLLVALQAAGVALLATWLFPSRFQWAGMLALPFLMVGAKVFQFYWIPPLLRRPAAWDPDYRKKMEVELRRLGVRVPANLFLYKTTDNSTLNGGHVGLGPWCRLMVSDTAPEALEPRELAVLLAREIAALESGASHRSSLAALAACMLGILLALGSSIAFTPPGWPQLAWMVSCLTTWGMICLPAFIWLSRRCVFAADARLSRMGVGRPELRSILKRVQQYNWTQWGSQDINVKFFAAMPSMLDRLERLEVEK